MVVIVLRTIFANSNICQFNFVTPLLPTRITLIWLPGDFLEMNHKTALGYDGYALELKALQEDKVGSSTSRRGMHWS
jgi:hypothetical protein